jgi:hypothetical protein
MRFLVSCRLLVVVVLLGVASGCTQGRAPAPAPQGGVAPKAQPPQNPQPPAPIASATPAPVTEPGTPLGDPAKPVADPAVLPDRTSPAAVVRSLAAALDARDLASLARLRKGTATKPALDERDTARAKIDFFGSTRETYWRKVLKAIDPAKLATLGTKEETRVSLPVTLGGARGDVQLVFERDGDAWVLVL